MTPTTDHTGRLFPSEKAMAEAWGIVYKTYANRKKRGWPLAKNLTTPGTKPERGQKKQGPKKPRGTPCTDHLGNRFPSQAAMLEKYSVERTTFKHRLKNGASLAQALGQAPMDLPTACQDHLGQRFQTKKEMLAHWGITQDVFRERKKNGWDLTTILETPMREPAQPVADHLGNVYGSVDEMAAHYGLNGTTVRTRLNRGHSLKKALTAKPGTLMQVTDHTGQIFATQSDMLRAWGVSAHRFQKDMAAGLTLEQALTRNRKHGCPKSDGIPKTDHAGKEWPSIKAMCDAYGVNANTFRSNIRKGMPVKDALAVKARPCSARSCIDWAGRAYGSMQEMARRLHVTIDRIKYWMAGKYADPENAAKHACASAWPGQDAGRYRIRECVEFPWFLCEDLDNEQVVPHAGEIILHADRILEMFQAEDGDGAA